MLAGPATFKSLQTHTERWLQYSHTVVGVLAAGGLATMFNAPLNGSWPSAPKLCMAAVGFHLSLVNKICSNDGSWLCSDILEPSSLNPTNAPSGMPHLARLFTHWQTYRQMMLNRLLIQHRKISCWDSYLPKLDSLHSVAAE
jgi:hypothetical protein